MFDGSLFFRSESDVSVCCPPLTILAVAVSSVSAKESVLCGTKVVPKALSVCADFVFPCLTLELISFFNDVWGISRGLFAGNKKISASLVYLLDRGPFDRFSTILHFEERTTVHKAVFDN